MADMEEMARATKKPSRRHRRRSRELRDAEQEETTSGRCARRTRLSAQSMTSSREFRVMCPLFSVRLGLVYVGFRLHGVRISFFFLDWYVNWCGREDEGF